MAYAKHKMPAIPCANREATAVPSTPVWKIRTNTKSNTIFSMLQVAKKIIGVFAFPNERSMLNGM